MTISELAVVALVCLPIVLLTGVMMKKMGFSDLTAIGLAILILTPLNWLILAYLAFFKWPIQEELELLRRQVDESKTAVSPQPIAQKDKSNALHAAVSKGYVDVVETLISQGADIHSKTVDGQSPLQLAIACEQNEIAELLRQHGATE